MNKKAVFFALIASVLIGLFASINYYYFTTGQIEEAKLLYEKGGGDIENFNSVFWVCNKIFTQFH
ncbi:MAG: hypothetical protein CMI90_05625 [Pelagibacteraceae bacterium]|nr:hypothetical protein [Pelagibacteraceae bacterium]